MSLAAHKPAAAVGVGRDAVRRGAAFVCGATSDGAVDVHVGHDGQAALQGGDDFGGGFRAVVFARMQDGEHHARLSDCFLCAF